MELAKHQVWKVSDELKICITRLGKATADWARIVPNVRMKHLMGSRRELENLLKDAELTDEEVPNGVSKKINRGHKALKMATHPPA